MKSIEDHIQKDKEILADPNTSEPMRHHIEDELHDLEEYVEHHKDEIAAGDHHDPNVLEVFCDVHPDEPECLVYDDQSAKQSAIHLYFMTPDKYDHILIHRNPFKQYSMPIEHKPYVYPKTRQIEIHYKCNSEFYNPTRTL